MARPKHKRKLTEYTCKYCGRTFYATNNNNRYACDAYACQRARINETRERAGAVPMKPRKCRWCGDMFLPKSRHANRRVYCYKPECQWAQKRCYYGISKEHAAKWRERQKKIKHEKPRPLCVVCGHPLPPGYKYRHDHCAALVGETQGNWIYTIPLEA